MMVFFIVPGEEGLRECSCIFNGTKSVGELGSVFHGLELRFWIWIIITDWGPWMTFGNTEIGKKKGNRFWCHGRSPVCMDQKLSTVSLSSLLSVFWQGLQVLYALPSNPLHICWRCRELHIDNNMSTLPVLLSFVISQDHTWLGASAISSGFT